MSQASLRTTVRQQSLATESTDRLLPLEIESATHGNSRGDPIAGGAPWDTRDPGSGGPQRINQHTEHDPSGLLNYARWIYWYVPWLGRH